MSNNSYDESKETRKPATAANADSIEETAPAPSAPQETEEVTQAEEPKITKKKSKKKEKKKGPTVKEMEKLQGELETALHKSAEYFDGWQRERADFTNFRKRIERDQVQTRQNITANIIRKYLVVLDDLDLALKNRPQDGEGASWADGIELISRKLHTVLENEGIQPLNPEGEEFDPSYHEAITSEDSPDHESGQIIEVLQKGFILGERVIRPARVRVAR